MTNLPNVATKPIAVFAHAHYPDIWAEMSERLAERLTLPFHLIVTTAGATKDIILPHTPALLLGRVMSVENRGRDILPFLRAFNELEDFELGLKLHTKKSPQRGDGAHWRRAMLDDLIPPQSGVEELVRRLRDDPRIGLVAPTGFSLSVAPWILINEPEMRRVLSTIGRDMDDDDLQDVFFGAGSMFWFRRNALAPLATPKVVALFEPEEGQLDGTVAHASERLFPIIAKREGFVSLATSGLRASWPSMTNNDLTALARRYADHPTTYFPGPGILELPPGTPPPLKVAAEPPATPVRLLMPIVLLLRAALPDSARRALRRIRRLLRPT